MREKGSRRACQTQVRGETPETRALFDSCLNRLTVANLWPESLGEGLQSRRLVSCCLGNARSGLDQASQEDLVRNECDIHLTTQVPG